MPWWVSGIACRILCRRGGRGRHGRRRRRRGSRIGRVDGGIGSRRVGRRPGIRSGPRGGGKCGRGRIGSTWWLSGLLAHARRCILAPATGHLAHDGQTREGLRVVWTREATDRACKVEATERIEGSRGDHLCPWSLHLWQTFLDERDVGPKEGRAAPRAQLLDLRRCAGIPVGRVASQVRAVDGFRVFSLGLRCSGFSKTRVSRCSLCLSGRNERKTAA